MIIGTLSFLMSSMAMAAGANNCGNGNDGNPPDPECHQGNSGNNGGPSNPGGWGHTVYGGNADATSSAEATAEAVAEANAQAESTSSANATVGDVTNTNTLTASGNNTSVMIEGARYREAANAVFSYVNTACGVAAGGSDRGMTLSFSKGQSAFCKNLTMYEILKAAGDEENANTALYRAFRLAEMDYNFSFFRTVITLGIYGD